MTFRIHQNGENLVGLMKEKFKPINSLTPRWSEWQTLKQNLKYAKIDFKKSATKTNNKFNSSWELRCWPVSFTPHYRTWLIWGTKHDRSLVNFEGSLKYTQAAEQTENPAEDSFVSFLKQFDSCPKWLFINSQNKSWSLSSRKIFPPLNTHKLKTYKICTLKWVRKLLSISSRDNHWAPNSWYQTISADFHWEFGWKEESSMVFELLPCARITTAGHIATRKQKNL